eukprot:scaffold94861_cov26-Tisochrysis_lutea.AAC.2
MCGAHCSIVCVERQIANEDTARAYRLLALWRRACIEANDDLCGKEAWGQVTKCHTRNASPAHTLSPSVSHLLHRSLANPGWPLKGRRWIAQIHARKRDCDNPNRTCLSPSIPPESARAFSTALFFLKVTSAVL